MVGKKKGKVHREKGVDHVTLSEPRIGYSHRRINSFKREQS